MIDLVQVARNIKRSDSTFHWGKNGDIHVFSNGFWAIRTSKGHPKSLTNKLNSLFEDIEPKDGQTIIRTNGNITVDEDHQLHRMIGDTLSEDLSELIQTHLQTGYNTSTMRVFITEDEYAYYNQQFCDMINNIYEKRLLCSGQLKPLLAQDGTELVLIMPVRNHERSQYLNPKYKK